jgi:hypothetical protein
MSAKSKHRTRSFKESHRLTVGGGHLATIVVQTGQPARSDNYAD